MPRKRRTEKDRIYLELIKNFGALANVELAKEAKKHSLFEEMSSAALEKDIDRFVAGHIGKEIQRVDGRLTRNLQSQNEFSVGNKELSEVINEHDRMITKEPLKSPVHNQENNVRLEGSKRRCEILITYPELKRTNYWESASIRKWISKPCGEGEGKDDHMYEIRGKALNCPLGCLVRIYVMRKSGKWPEIGGEISDSDGTWSGNVFLHIENKDGQVEANGTIHIGVDLFERESETAICSSIFTIMNRKPTKVEWSS